MGEPGLLQSMGLQGAGPNLAIEQQEVHSQECLYPTPSIQF